MTASTATHAPHLAFCLYKYFPFGGMQRNFLRIARECVQRGARVRVYVLDWQAEDKPDNLDIVMVPKKGLTNPARYRFYNQWVQAHLHANPVDAVVGFNKMPGLDVYYAADPCYAEKARSLRGWWYRYSARYRHFIQYERAVFAAPSNTTLMLLSHPEREIFDSYYRIDPDRIVMLPPGISREFVPDASAPTRRQALRDELGLGAEQVLLVQVGSDFQRKGVDRSLRALAALPAELRERVRFVVIGQASATGMQRLARSLGVDGQTDFIGGSNRVPDFLLAADLLLHPAYHENTGNVILEAMVSGLPSIVTRICGYSPYLEQAQCGVVLEAPYQQDDFDRALARAVAEPALRRQWADNARRYADQADIYSRIERAADVIMNRANANGA